jgi:hypothetical protein
MKNDEPKLVARREALLRRSAELRSRIAEDAGEISNRLRVVDKASGFLRTGGGRAVVWAGMLLIVMTGPGKVLKVASRTAFTLSLARRWLPRIMAFKRGSPRA